MSRKAREDQSTWKMPSIEVFNAGYGPFRSKGVDAIEDSLIWFHSSTNDEDGRHPLYTLAASVQELLLQKRDVRFSTIICIDLKYMFDGESEYQEAFDKEIEEVELTKGFGKKLQRLLQRMVLQNVIIAAQKSFCAILIKLYKALYFVDPDIVSELWLLHPDICTKFVNTHLVDDTHKFDSTQVNLVLEKKKNNRAGILKCFFPTLKQFVIPTPNNWFSVIALSEDSSAPPGPYDPEYINDRGETLFMSNMKVEMNRFSKQYERNCDNVTPNLMEITSDASDEETIDLASVDWSSCERHIGGLVLRGNRCILVRSLTQEWEGMRIPTVVPMPEESPHDAAIRAVVEFAEVDPDEVHALPHVLPIALYAPGGRPILVELYPLYANNPPPDIPLEEVDLEDEDDVYDWYTFPNALQRLDESSNASLLTMAHGLIQASRVGLVPIKWGGIFGQELIRGEHENHELCNDEQRGMCGIGCTICGDAEEAIEA